MRGKVNVHQQHDTSAYAYYWRNADLAWRAAIWQTYLRERLSARHIGNLTVYWHVAHAPLQGPHAEQKRKPKAI